MDYSPVVFTLWGATGPYWAAADHMQILNGLAARIEAVSPKLLKGGLFILAVLLYAHTFGYDFVLDDVPIFTRHRFVAKGIAGIPEILSTPYWYGYADSANGLYRPVSLVLFACLKSLCGATPFSGHVLSVLLYAGSVVVFDRFLMEIFGPERQLFSLAASLLFLVHPVHTEVVANVKSCDETLSFIFSVTALTLIGRYFKTRRTSSLAGGLICVLLAVLSKESAVCLALLLPLLALRIRPERKPAILGIAGMLFTISIVLALRMAILHRYEAGGFHATMADNLLAGTSGFGDRLANAFMLIGHYMRLLFVPAPLICDYSYITLPLRRWIDPQVWMALIACLAFLSIAVHRLLRDRRDAIGFGILFFFIGIALFSNLFFLIGTTFGERFLFLPSAGFCIAVSALLTKLPSGLPNTSEPAPRLWFRLVVLAAVLPVFTFMSLDRSRNWADAEQLFSTDIPKAPLNYRLPYYLATDYIMQSTEITDPGMKRNYMQQALELLRGSVANYDRFGQSQSELGHIFMSLGFPDSGFYYNSRALALNPNDTFTRNNIAGYYFAKGNFPESIRLSRINLGIDPKARQPYTNIAAAWLKLGRGDSALEPLRRAWSLEPGNPRTGYFLNIAYGMNGQADSAKLYESFVPK